MNYEKIISELIAERDKLEGVIGTLQELQHTMRPQLPGQNRRGRRGMGAEERLEVSARMKRYWSERRRKKGAHA